MEFPTKIGVGRRVQPSVREGGQPRAENVVCAFEAATRLNSLRIANREYAVTRDRGSDRFLVLAVDQTTRAILDRFVPEEILRMIERLSGLSAVANGEKKA